MKTNYQMLKDLNKKYDSMKHTKGFLTKEEVNLISKDLCLKEMNILQLRNLRDFTVLFLSRGGGDEMDMLDKVSAITHVIDNEIWSKGGEV